MREQYKIAITGNPNSGKTSLFNALTGLNQKVGNFPGVTVDKKTGYCTLAPGDTAIVTDLPGTYSLYPRSADEVVACSVLLDPANPVYPDLIIVVADASNLKRNLLFCSQIMDLKIPVILALTMNDIARQKGVIIDTTALERNMGIPVVSVNPRKSRGMDLLKKRIIEVRRHPIIPAADFIDIPHLTDNPDMLSAIRKMFGLHSDYAALQFACGYKEATYIPEEKKKELAALITRHHFQKAKIQAAEVLQRYHRIDGVMRLSVAEENPVRKKVFTEQMDKVLLHPIWGNIVLLLILFLMFQSIFWLAAYPMDWIDVGFSSLNGWLGMLLPDSLLKDLLLNGILAGIGGVVIFIPQIMILFGLITLLEDSGYMARISFLTDRMMRGVGLNGRSVMPLISGVACAVPAIMAARTIQNRKERLITIMVTPLMSCSARLPVYTILTSLVIPDTRIWIFNLHGLVMMGLYLLGFVAAMLVAWVMHLVIKAKETSFFLMELPVYRAPRWKNALITMVEKARIFVTEAGKVIMVISIILWVMASFGPPGRMAAVEEDFAARMVQTPEEKGRLQGELQSARLGESFAGIMGRAIEPAIAPIGYDWKIGIALITSFAAREVFVGTMATLYSVGGDEADMETTLREKMTQARRSDGTPVYTLATGVSLLIFYAFAMQCMSTLAIVKREMGSWKYAAIQFVYMLVLAYAGAFVAYRLLL